MIGFITRRGLSALPLLLGVASLVFALIHLVPGDPVETMLGTGAGAADVEALRRRLGLHRPLAAQYAAFLSGLARGDLGASLRYGDPVAALLRERLPATVVLALAALSLTAAVALPAGIAAALRPGGAVDRMLTVGSAAALAIPGFWLGPLLVLLFAVRLDWLPVSGGDAAGAIILPAVTLAATSAAILARLLRAALAEQASAPYVRAARGRGLSARGAALRHALPNALPPVLTIGGLQLGSLLTGAILTETIFAWPGIGRLLVQAIGHRDYPLVQGCVLLIAATYIAVNVAVDIAHGMLDPRVSE